MYSVFLSYRVASDAPLARLIFDELNHTMTPGGHRVTVYWDAHRLVKGERWEEGFMQVAASTCARRAPRRDRTESRGLWAGRRRRLGEGCALTVPRRLRSCPLNTHEIWAVGAYMPRDSGMLRRRQGLLNSLCVFPILSYGATAPLAALPEGQLPALLAQGWEQRPMGRDRLNGLDSDAEDNVLKEWMIAAALLERADAVASGRAARADGEDGVLQAAYPIMVGRPHPPGHADYPQMSSFFPLQAFPPPPSHPPARRRQWRSLWCAAPTHGALPRAQLLAPRTHARRGDEMDLSSGEADFSH